MTSGPWSMGRSRLPSAVARPLQDRRAMPIFSSPVPPSSGGTAPGRVPAHRPGVRTARSGVFVRLLAALARAARAPGRKEHRATAGTTGPSGEGQPLSAFARRSLAAPSSSRAARTGKVRSHTATGLFRSGRVWSALLLARSGEKTGTSSLVSRGRLPFRSRALTVIHDAAAVSVGAVPSEVALAGGAAGTGSSRGFSRDPVPSRSAAPGPVVFPTGERHGRSLSTSPPAVQRTARPETRLGVPGDRMSRSLHAGDQTPVRPIDPAGSADTVPVASRSGRGATRPSLRPVVVPDAAMHGSVSHEQTVAGQVSRARPEKSVGQPSVRHPAVAGQRAPEEGKLSVPARRGVLPAIRASNQRTLSLRAARRSSPGISTARADVRSSPVVARTATASGGSPLGPEPAALAARVGPAPRAADAGQIPALPAPVPPTRAGAPRRASGDRPGAVRGPSGDPTRVGPESTGSGSSAPMSRAARVGQQAVAGDHLSHPPEEDTPVREVPGTRPGAQQPTGGTRAAVPSAAAQAWQAGVTGTSGQSGHRDGAAGSPAVTHRVPRHPARSRHRPGAQQARDRHGSRAVRDAAPGRAGSSRARTPSRGVETGPERPVASVNELPGSTAPTPSRSGAAPPVPSVWRGVVDAASTARPGTRLTLKLDESPFGRLRITVIRRGHAVRIRVIAADDAAQASLRGDRALLSHALAARGLRLDGMHVDVSSASPNPHSGGGATSTDTGTSSHAQTPAGSGSGPGERGAEPGGRSPRPRPSGGSPASRRRGTASGPLEGPVNRLHGRLDLQV
ncbi:MAG: flagellar hook-length control protein FliK [Acidobacteriota bacterium]